MTIVWLIYDAGDARVRKRIRAMLDLQWNCVGFSFSRIEGMGRKGIFWNDVDLGFTRGGHYLTRSVKVLSAVWRIVRTRNLLKKASIIYAFNIDNLILAFWAKCLTGYNCPVIYECADIQPVFMERSFKGWLFRSLERWALGKIDLLVTTSPAFAAEYFHPVQDFRGPLYLLENKVYPTVQFNFQSRIDVDRGKPNNAKENGQVVIGYFGSFRCQRSLETIAELTVKLGGRAKFLLAGFPTPECAPHLNNCIVKSNGAVAFLGRFEYPADLPRLYEMVDCCWGFDWSADAGNSKWLLPNRLYESGLFGRPILASQGTHLGSVIENEEWGWAFPEPIVQTLGSWLAHPPWTDLKDASDRLVACRDSRFRGEREYERISSYLEDRVSRVGLVI